MSDNSTVIWASLLQATEDMEFRPYFLKDEES
jgi:hypothetical protein